jgi:hypothetical protein
MTTIVLKPHPACKPGVNEVIDLFNGAPGEILPFASVHIDLFFHVSSDNELYNRLYRDGETIRVELVEEGVE